MSARSGYTDALVVQADEAFAEHRLIDRGPGRNGSSDYVVEKLNIGLGLGASFGFDTKVAVQHLREFLLALVESDADDDTTSLVEDVIEYIGSGDMDATSALRYLDTGGVDVSELSALGQVPSVRAIYGWRALRRLSDILAGK